MDKLQSAMDRFKEQRDAAHASPRPNGSYAVVPPAVLYSWTRSVVIPDEMLQRHRILTGRDQLRLFQLKRVHAGNAKQTS
jgi:hypothetical protein